MSTAAHSKESVFYGPFGPLGVLVMYERFYKVHGSNDTVATVAAAFHRATRAGWRDDRQHRVPTVHRRVPGVHAIKARAIASLRLEAGSSVVDLGCGPAIDTLEMGRSVGPTGVVVGVDRDPGMVDEANHVGVQVGLGIVVRHIVGDATSLPFGSGEFNTGFSERLLQHLSPAEAAKAVDEMARVVRPGGRVTIVDTDWATLSVASLDPWLERRVVGEYVRRFPNPFSGRSLPGLCRSVGLREMSVECFDLRLSSDTAEFLLAPAVRAGLAAGRLSWSDAQRWTAEVQLGRDYGTFFAHASLVMVTGSR